MRDNYGVRLMRVGVFNIARVFQDKSPFHLKKDIFSIYFDTTQEIHFIF